MNEDSADSGQLVYQVRVEGLLHDRWSEWLGATASALVDNKETILTVVVPDQAALRGLLCRMWDLNLTLISLRRFESREGVSE